MELDAAVMDGRRRTAGAVTLVRTVKNPITSANASRIANVRMAEVTASRQRIGSMSRRETMRGFMAS